MPILRQHDVAEPRRETVDDRNDLVAARHRQCAAGTEIVLHVDHDEDAIVTERRTRSCSRHRDCGPCCCRRRSTSAARSCSSGATSTGYVASGSRRRKGSGSRSSSRLVRSLISASDSGGRSRWPFCITGDEQLFAALTPSLAFECKRVASHAAVGLVAAPHLLAPGPGGLVLRFLPPRQAGIFLQLVDAVDVGHVGGRGEARADAEAIDRSRLLHQRWPANPRRVRRWQRSQPRRGRLDREFGARSWPARRNRRCRAARCGWQCRRPSAAAPAPRLYAPRLRCRRCRATRSDCRAATAQTLRRPPPRRRTLR